MLAKKTHRLERLQMPIEVDDALRGAMQVDTPKVKSQGKKKRKAKKRKEKAP